MGVFHWVGTNWFDVLQSVGIVASLLFTGVALKEDTRARRVDHLITFTDRHRDIWREMYHRPELARVISERPNVVRKPVTNEEALFVRLIILHLASVHRAINDGMFTRPEGLDEDVRWFFTLPIPRQVWDNLKSLQNEDFRRFVESCVL